MLKQQWGSKLSVPRLDKDHRNNIGNLKWTSWSFGLLELQLKQLFLHLISPCSWCVVGGSWVKDNHSVAFSQNVFLLLLSFTLTELFHPFLSTHCVLNEKSQNVHYIKILQTLQCLFSCYCCLFWCCFYTFCVWHLQIF